MSEPDLSWPFPEPERKIQFDSFGMVVPDYSGFDKLVNTCEIGERDESFDPYGRKYYKLQKEVDGKIGVTECATDDDEAILIGSKILGYCHYPVIDIDVPMRLVPSSTPGHHHLYIDMPISWADYQDLLRTLARIGIVEDGYANVAIQRGATYVRLPWVKKIGRNA